MQSTPHRLSRLAPRPARSAFSLIELMVVILIIAILAGLLLNGVMAARQAAVNAGIVAEMKGLEKSIQDFKMKYGVEPPSFMVLFEDRAAWSTIPAVPAGQSWTPADVQRSRSIIRQIWPEYYFGTTSATYPNLDINGDNDTTDILELRGAECLVFFLGGVCATDIVGSNGLRIPDPPAPAPPTPANSSPVQSWASLGFSVNPTNPFVRGGTRVGPQHAFDTDRLTNLDSQGSTLDTEGMPEFLDNQPGQTKPYIFASSYEGKGYRPADLVTGPSCTFTTIYTQASGQSYNPNTFQIIAAGVDGEYGIGGVLDGNLPATRAAERDNLTNFKGGRLE